MQTTEQSIQEIALIIYKAKSSPMSTKERMKIAEAIRDHLTDNTPEKEELVKVIEDSKLSYMPRREQSVIAEAFC